MSSVWCNVHGHRHPKLDAALRRSSTSVAHVTSLGSSNPTTIELAKRLVEIAPRGLGARLLFATTAPRRSKWRSRWRCNTGGSGSDPRPDKTTYVALGDAYHGDTLGSVSVGGVERFHAMFRPLLFDVLRAPRPTCIGCRRA